MVIALGRNPSRYAAICQSVDKVGELDAPFAMPLESGLSIWLPRSPRASLDAARPVPG